MKASVRENLRKELKTWFKPVLIVSFIFIVDELSEEYISKENKFEMKGCIQRTTTGTARSGLKGLVIQSQGEEISLTTYDKILIEQMKNHIGECFSFTIYRHSFWIPNIGRQWLVEVNPINNKK